MPRKPPPVSLRKPPAPVDLDRAERFVRAVDEPPPRPESSSVETRPAVAATAHREPANAAATEPARAHHEPANEARSDRTKTLADRPSNEVARPASKSLVERRDGRALRRMTVYLPDDLARELAVYCAREDLDLSAAVTESVRRLLTNKNK